MKISPAVQQRRFHGISRKHSVLIFQLCACVRAADALFFSISATGLQVVPQSPQYRQRADDYIRGRDTVHACLAQLSDCHPEMRRHGALMKRGAELCIHLLSSNHTHETRGLDLHTPTAHNLSTKPLLLNVNLTHQDGSYFLCLSVSLSLCAALW